MRSEKEGAGGPGAAVAARCPSGREKLSAVEVQFRRESPRREPEAPPASSLGCGGGTCKPREERKTVLSKVVIRRLPPSLTKEQLEEQLHPLPAHDYFEFFTADFSLYPHLYSRAYINFRNPDDILLFRDRFDGYIFIDSKGLEYPAVVEFAPFQKIAKKKLKKKDAKTGSIEDDPEYKKFLENYCVEEEKANANPETLLGDIEAKTRELIARRTTPLLEYIRNRKLEKQRIREEKREERRRRELEKKRLREEEKRKKREEEKCKRKEADKQKRTAEREVRIKVEGMFGKHQEETRKYLKNGTKDFLRSQKRERNQPLRSQKTEERKWIFEMENRSPVLAVLSGSPCSWGARWRSPGKSHRMTAIKSKGRWTEDSEKKILKHKDAMWMTAESIELTVSLTGFQGEMKKSQNGGKEAPQTEGRRGVRTVASLWRQQSGPGKSRGVKVAQHPKRSAQETRIDRPCSYISQELAFDHKKVVGEPLWSAPTGAGVRLTIQHRVVPRRTKRQGESACTFDWRVPFSILQVREGILEMYESALNLTCKVNLLLIKKSETINLNVA